MIKLLDILKELQLTAGIITEEEAKKLTPQEQKIVDDILGGLDEGLFDDVLEKAKKYAKKGLLTASIMAALLAAPNLSKAEKAQLQTLKPDTTTTATDSTKGTFVDGKIGKFTSRFKFPKLTNDNTFLPDSTNSVAITANEMQQWNDFVDWMEIQGHKGDSAMDHTKQSLEVLNQYSKQSPGFWVKSPEDVKKIQKYIKAFRVFSLKRWKEAGEKSKIHNANYDKISPEERVDIESRFMPYAK
jgi:hypothetical protein